MKMNTIVSKMEEYVQDFRAQLEKKDPASLAVLTKNMKTFFEDLEGELPANADLGEKVRSFKGCVERFGKACEQNNMQEAAQALSEMETTVKKLREQCSK